MKWWGFAMETVMQDLRFALRQMRKNPGFAATAILILALGMGVSVAIFGFVDAALLKPLPYANPDRLVAWTRAARRFRGHNLSYADYQDWKRMNTVIQLDWRSTQGRAICCAWDPAAEPVPAARVSDGFFSTLGVKPMLGRDFCRAKTSRAGKIVMLSYGAWLKRFGGRRDVIGQSVNLSGEAYTIVGVLPREFAFAPRGNAEFWVPLLDKTRMREATELPQSDGIGRLRDGVTMQARTG